MPVPKEGSIVLVSGASGYVASWVCLQLLEKGYRIRGTVRSTAKGEWMKDMYAKRGLGVFDFVVVEDLENENAFDEAIKGVDAFVHIASPFHWNVTQPDDFIRPAVAGTVSALKAALKETSVKRVIVTSSYAAVLEPVEPVHIFTEQDWNQVSIDEVEKKGAEAWRMHWYRASKTLAEKAAWDFMKQNNPSGLRFGEALQVEISPCRDRFDLATICPPYILGPIIHEASSPDKLNTSVAAWYSYLMGEKTDDDAVAPAGILCDVRDVASVHVSALLTKEAAGHRFGVSTCRFNYQMLLDYLHEDDELAKAFPRATSGKRGQGPPPQNIYDVSNAIKILGYTPTSAKCTAIDMTRSLLHKKEEWPLN